MTRRLIRVIAVVVFMLAIGSSTAFAYTKTVIINLDGVPRMINTDKETVGDLMETLDDVISADYVLQGDVSKTTELTKNMVIDLTSITEKKTTKTETIAYDTEIRENPDLEEGKEKVLQEGENGELSIITKENYSGAKLISSEVVGELVTKEAKNKIIERGTKKEELPIVELKKEPANVTVSAAGSNSLNVVATGYTPGDPGCTGITYTGTKASRGTIAVDPKVIPFGTKLYIPGYGYGVAADTGGAIKGNKIDLCYETRTEALNWGIKNITVYVVK
ncbi:3D domain-containing protein [Lachnospiraceae bacterium 46-61]